MQSAQFALHADIEQRHWWFTARRQIMRRLVRQALPPSPEHLVVDIGCGTGANIASLAGDYRTVGIDTSADAIRFARDRFTQCEFLQGYAPADLGELAAQARMFLLMDVLEHVPDDFQLFSELLAAASPGAWFLVTVPADLALWSQHDESFGHYRRYDIPRLQSVWDGLPVETLLVSPYNSRLYPLVRAARARSRRQGAAGDAGTDFWLPSAMVNRTLEALFASEGRKLCKLASGKPGCGFRRGVSLIALLRRKAGRIQPRARPANTPADYFDPAQRELAGV